MITKNNTFSGASFSYEGNSVTATGEYRVENGSLASVDINGALTKEDKVYSFWARRDNSGNVNISGASASVIAEVASEVAKILSEIEAEINGE